jgi:hypothetical protein
MNGIFINSAGVANAPALDAPDTYSDGFDFTN